MSILVVGDVETVKAGLQSLPYGANLEVLEVKPPVPPMGGPRGGRGLGRPAGPQASEKAKP